MNIRNTIHGHTSNGTRSRTYSSWCCMLTRVMNKKSSNYKYYGARGVQICTRWLFFHNFLADMGEVPEGKTLDRFPVRDGNYEPGNCRWATPKEQAQNRRLPNAVYIDG